MGNHYAIGLSEVHQSRNQLMKYMYQLIQKIIDIVESFQLPKVKLFLEVKNFLDTSSTDAMLEFIEKMNFDEESIFILIQATSPFTKAEDIDGAIKKISKGSSVLSVCNFNRFIWDKNGL